MLHHPDDTAMPPPPRSTMGLMRTGAPHHGLATAGAPPARRSTTAATAATRCAQPAQSHSRAKDSPLPADGQLSTPSLRAFRSPRESFNPEADNFMRDRGSYQNEAAHPVR